MVRPLVDRMPLNVFQKIVAQGLRLLEWPNLILFIFPIMVWSGALVLKLYEKRVYGWLVKEDGLVEYVSALFYLVACLLSLFVYGNLRHHRHLKHIALLFLTLSIGLGFIFGEELSWGQRILGVETPEFISQYNQQNEINIHNTLNSQLVHMGYIIIGLYGMVGFHLVGKRIDGIIPQFSEWCLPRPSLALYFFPTFLVYFFGSSWK